ncbi:hypothetical protein T484DRAFT_1853919 [Baffinella frigidus]|nr:hypothetical protein T484DRAFT_1853919 [Cryptophyta sp. CCMP2293]
MVLLQVGAFRVRALGSFSRFYVYGQDPRVLPFVAQTVLETTAGGAWAKGAGLDGESGEQRVVRRAACATLGWSEQGRLADEEQERLTDFLFLLSASLPDPLQQRGEIRRDCASHIHFLFLLSASLLDTLHGIRSARLTDFLFLLSDSLPDPLHGIRSARLTDFLFLLSASLPDPLQQRSFLEMLLQQPILEWHLACIVC